MIAKSGVLIERVGHRAGFEIGYAVGIAARIYEGVGARLVVTSLTDGVHSAGSLHPKGFAVDLRTRDLNDIERNEIFQELRDHLEPQGFDVIYEADKVHFHIEFQPKAGEKFIQFVR